ncbi:MAG: hypothetical protein U9P00_02715 [Pseudomonadota bacterium]|nr:hypothetical protein [Pseudomonadota bacterium]
MMNRPLKQAVREYFERDELSTDQLERLEALMAGDEQRPADRLRRLPGSVLGWSMAAAIAALLAIFVILPPNLVEDTPMTERIAMEVARNHIKLKPLDVETDNMDGIRRYFTDLEFVPVKSQLLASSNLELLGGRYCSIQSVPAAQIRVMRADSNRLQTLYQSEYRKDVFGPLPVLENGDLPVAVRVKGITVRIWVEKGLLFALTDEAGLETIEQSE